MRAALIGGLAGLTVAACLAALATSWLAWKARGREQAARVALRRHERLLHSVAQLGSTQGKTLALLVRGEKLLFVLTGRIADGRRVYVPVPVSGNAYSSFVTSH